MLSRPRTSLPMSVRPGSTTTSALGLTINTLPEPDEASTSVCPTTTPYSSVKHLAGSTKAQPCGLIPDTENSATISLSGGITTNVVKSPSRSGVNRCWCNCNVDHHLPTTDLYADPIGVVGRTVRLLCPINRQNQYWPPQKAYHNIVPETQWPTPAGPELSRERSQPIPAGGGRVATLSAQPDPLRSNTVVDKIIT